MARQDKQAGAGGQALGPWGAGARGARACGARSAGARRERARGVGERPVRTWACWLGCGLCT